MLFSAETARKFFTDRSVSVRLYVASADPTDQRLRITHVNSNLPVNQQIILAFEDMPCLGRTWLLIQRI
jgi:hypothetical protein